MCCQPSGASALSSGRKRKMALFNKEPENNGRSENPHDTSPVPFPSPSQSLGENLRSAHHAASASREPGFIVGKPSDIRAYLDSRTNINGKLSFEGPVQIDGHIEGEIVAREDVLIGESAQVTARIKAN